jgi:hypothetical protein
MLAGKRKRESRKQGGGGKLQQRKSPHALHEHDEWVVQSGLYTSKNKLWVPVAHAGTVRTNTTAAAHLHVITPFHAGLVHAIQKVRVRRFLFQANVIKPQHGS